MAGGARAATSGFLGLFGSREACLIDFGGAASTDIYVLCHEARGMDLSPGEQISVSLRDLTRSEPDRVTSPGSPWHLRAVKPSAVLQLSAWAAPREGERRLLGELRLPIAQLKALGLDMLYQTWIALDPPGVSPASGVSAEELEQKMSDGCRQLFQPKLCLSIKEGDGHMALLLDAPHDMREDRWSAVLRSQMQHMTMSSQLHLSSKVPRNGSRTASVQQIQDALARVSEQALKLQDLRLQLRARGLNGDARVSQGTESVRAQQVQAEAQKLRQENEFLQEEIERVRAGLSKVSGEANEKIDAANVRIRQLRDEKEAVMRDGDALRAAGERLVRRQEECRKERQELEGQKEALLRIVEDLHQTCKSAGMTNAGRHSIKDIGDLAASYRLA